MIEMLPHTVQVLLSMTKTNVIKTAILQNPMYQKLSRYILIIISSVLRKCHPWWPNVQNTVKQILMSNFQWHSTASLNCTHIKSSDT